MTFDTCSQLQKIEAIWYVDVFDEIAQCIHRLEYPKEAYKCTMRVDIYAHNIVICVLYFVSVIELVP